MGPLGTDYDELRSRIDALVRPLADRALGLPVPATPGWSAHDVIAHLCGITDDALAGRMDGAPGEAWTAAQVERGRGVPTVELLDRWAAQGPVFAGYLDSVGEQRAVFDILSHYFDLLGALGVASDRTERLVIEYAGTIVAGLPWVAVDAPSGRLTPDAGPGVPVVATTEFEVLRSRLGRRSATQVRAYDWSVDPGDRFDHWFIFGPAVADLVE